MQWFGLGKIIVATSGAPVPLSSTHVKCHEVKVSYDPADGTDTVFVKDRSGAIIAAIASPTAQPIVFKCKGDNALDLLDFQIDAGTNSAGPYVGYGIE